MVLKGNQKETVAMRVGPEISNQAQKGEETSVSGNKGGEVPLGGPLLRKPTTWRSPLDLSNTLYCPDKQSQNAQKKKKKEQKQYLHSIDEKMFSWELETLVEKNTGTSFFSGSTSSF